MSSLHFKSDFVPIPVICVQGNDIDSMRKDLNTSIVSAPQFFNNASVIIDVSSTNEAVPLAAIQQMLIDRSIRPFGIRGVRSDQEAEARTLGLHIMKKSAVKPEAEAPSLLSGQKKHTPESRAPKSSKFITQPVRAGTQVYAKDADLVIVSAVNAGAECLADGHIHIYGPLRGKALAGCQGDVTARIFCRSLEAELISIAGHYLTCDDIVVPANAEMIQIFLKDSKLMITAVN